MQILFRTILSSGTNILNTAESLLKRIMSLCGSLIGHYGNIRKPTNKETSTMSEIKYEILKQVGVLSKAASGWAKTPFVPPVAGHFPQNLQNNNFIKCYNFPRTWRMGACTC